MSGILDALYETRETQADKKKQPALQEGLTEKKKVQNTGKETVRKTETNADADVSVKTKSVSQPKPQTVSSEAGFQESEEAFLARIRSEEAAKKTASGKPKKKYKRCIPGEVKQIRNVPSEVVSVLQSEFPDARNIADALSAYVYVHSGKNLQVSEEVERLAENWSGDLVQRNIEMRLSAMERRIAKIQENTETCELGIAVLSADRFWNLCISKDEPTNAAIRQSKTLRYLKKLRLEAKEQRRKDNEDSGRPIK